MTHKKITSTPKRWPTPRKGATFIVHSGGRELPLLIALRDILKLAKTRKEVKKAIHNKSLLVSGKFARDDKQALNLLDTLTIIPMKKNYLLGLSEKGKFEFKEIAEEKAKTKISKIIDKKILKNKKVQLNLFDGKNILESKECSVNDSVLLDLDKKKVLKILPLKKGANILVIEGKHSGIKGEIKEINPALKMVEIDKKGEKINVLIKQLMVIEEK